MDAHVRIRSPRQSNARNQTPLETLTGKRKLSYSSLVSRPDLSYATGYLGLFSACSNNDHLRALHGAIDYTYHT